MKYSVPMMHIVSVWSWVVVHTIDIPSLKKSQDMVWGCLHQC